MPRFSVSSGSCCGWHIAFRVGAAHKNPFLHTLARLALPLFFLLATPAVTYLALAQINLIGSVGSAIELTATTTIMFLACAWIVWRIAPYSPKRSSPRPK